MHDSAGPSRCPFRACFVLAWVALLLLCHPAQAAEVPALQACDEASSDKPWTLLQAVAAETAAAPAAALWINSRLLRWAGLSAPAADDRYRLLYSSRGGLQTTPGEAARGVEEAVPMLPYSGALASAEARSTQWFPHGLVLAVPNRSLPRLKALYRGQLLLVQEDAQGRVIQSTRVQHARALDDLYAAAEQEPHLGATLAAKGGATRFKLWAPTAQSVWLCLHADGVAPASAVHTLLQDRKSVV